MADHDRLAELEAECARLRDSLGEVMRALETLIEEDEVPTRPSVVVTHAYLVAVHALAATAGAAGGGE